MEKALLNWQSLNKRNLNLSWFTISANEHLKQTFSFKKKSIISILTYKNHLKHQSLIKKKNKRRSHKNQASPSIKIKERIKLHQLYKQTKKQSYGIAHTGKTKQQSKPTGNTLMPVQKTLLQNFTFSCNLLECSGLTLFCPQV